MISASGLPLPKTMFVAESLSGQISSDSILDLRVLSCSCLDIKNQQSQEVYKILEIQNIKIKQKKTKKNKKRTKRRKKLEKEKKKKKKINPLILR
jgi:3-methyladenine DNA glycosylase AlkC